MLTGKRALAKTKYRDPAADGAVGIDVGMLVFAISNRAFVVKNALGIIMEQDPL
jgi:hypothetical protein